MLRALHTYIIFSLKNNKYVSIFSRLFYLVEFGFAFFVSLDNNIILFVPKVINKFENYIS